MMQRRHLTSPANPGSPRDPAPKPAPTPPPTWRWWLPLVGILATILLLWSPSVKTTPTVSLNYTSFLARVETNKVVTASIDPNGGVTGRLKNGDNYTTQIPTVLNDAQLAPTLRAHDVSVAGVGSSSS